MALKKKHGRGVVKKTGKKAKHAKSEKAHPATRRIEKARVESPVSVKPLIRVGSSPKEFVRITLDNIRAETAIGDLLVAFPRTREVLARNGLRLEAEDAGDIYMSVEAFSALNGLKAESLVQELIDIAKEPPAQQPVSQVAIPATV